MRKGKTLNKKAPESYPKKSLPEPTYLEPTNDMDWDQLAKLQELGVDVSDDIIRDTDRFKGLDTVDLVNPQGALRRHNEQRRRPITEKISDKIRDFREDGGKDFMNKLINLLK